MGFMDLIIHEQYAKTFFNDTGNPFFNYFATFPRYTVFEIPFKQHKNSYFRKFVPHTDNFT